MPISSDTTASNPTRELAAIMFSDVVGYTAIMGRDGQEAFRALDAHREFLRASLPKFNGRMVGEIGDGTLTAFHSAIDAVNCAREVQTSLRHDQPELTASMSPREFTRSPLPAASASRRTSTMRSATSRAPASGTSASAGSRTYRARFASMLSR